MPMASKALDQVLINAVDAGSVPHIVAVAGNEYDTIYSGACGPRAAGEQNQISADTILRITSQTKMVTTVAALQQVEAGALELNAPVDAYCPEFGELLVLEGFNGHTPVLRAPSSRATVRQLMTHTSGLAYWFYNDKMAIWKQIAGSQTTSARKGLFRAPLVADPGVRFEYGISTDWLGKVLEVVCGKSLALCFNETIFNPLGMSNTTFLMNDLQQENAAPVHVRDEDGRWLPTDTELAQRPGRYSGGHGLYSTAHDYLLFQRMILAGGSLGNVGMLEPSTVAAIFANQIGELDFPPSISSADPAFTYSANHGSGLKFGLGLMLNTEDKPGMRSAGSGTWGGIFNTNFWIDRAKGVTGAVYSQCLPNLDPLAFQVWVDFERKLYELL